MLSDAEFIRQMVEADTLEIYQSNQVLISDGDTDHSSFYDFRSSNREMRGWYRKVA